MQRAASAMDFCCEAASATDRAGKLFFLVAEKAPRRIMEMEEEYERYLAAGVELQRQMLGGVEVSLNVASRR